MFKTKNIVAIGLLFFALAIFSFLSLGGEFFHSRIHHHETAASHDECSIYLLQAQAFLTFLATFVTFWLKITPLVVTVCCSPILRSHHNLPNLRAPPASL